jgi:dTDP-4-dehydrorhamnose reductase
MRILISGASGLLGSALQKAALAQGHACRALDRTKVPQRLDPAALLSFDALLDDVDHVVHAAANTNVERCEYEPQACYRDNVLMTEILVGAARRRGVPVTFISSTGVYGSYKTEPYFEFDDARPETHHHRSKLQAEQIVLAADWRNLVVRTGWLFGGSAQAPKNFVAKRILEAYSATAGYLSSNHEQRGCPTFVDDLANRLLELITLKARGVFNAVNEGSASRFEYVREIIGQAGMEVEVRPVGATGFNRIAPVSNNEMAINWRASEFGLTPMRSWQLALASYLASINLQQLAP